MNNEITLNDFKTKTGIKSVIVLKQLLGFLFQHKIGLLLEKNGKKTLSFSDVDRIKISLLSLELGCDIQECSKLLSWKDFEYFTSELLNLFEYNTKVNIVLSKPRVQLDVIGIKNNFAITIDCKHWKYNNNTTLSIYAEKQKRRSLLWLNRQMTITTVLPIIITLFSSDFRFIQGVPIVPIVALKSFLNDFDKYEDSITLIKKTHLAK
jgi:Mg2+/citrate symporter